MRFIPSFLRAAKPTLADLVEGERATLEDILGPEFVIKRDNYGSCEIIGPNFEIDFIDDRRDPWICPNLRPTGSGQLFDRKYGAGEWLNFLGLRKKYFVYLPEYDHRGLRELEAQQVRDAIAVVRPIAELWKDPQATRDAYWFMRGSNVAYNEKCQRRVIEDSEVKTQRDAMWFERGKAYQRSAH